MKRALAALLVLLAAQAQAATINRGAFQGVAMTGASQQVIGPQSVLPTPVAQAGTFLYLENAGSGPICIGLGVPATIAAGVCGPGQILLNGPGAFRLFDIAAPADPIYAIGASGGSLTVGAQ